MLKAASEWTNKSGDLGLLLWANSGRELCVNCKNEFGLLEIQTMGGSVDEKATAEVKALRARLEANRAIGKRQEQHRMIEASRGRGEGNGRDKWDQFSVDGRRNAKRKLFAVRGKKFRSDLFSNM